MAGSELRRLRVLAGQTQYQLAKESGIDRTRISLAENDYVQLTMEESKKLARAVLAIMERQLRDLQTKAGEAKTLATLYGEPA
jgi:transcriptional regulator with XRE-family HTH domain